MKPVLTALLGLFSCAFGLAQVIPDTLRTDWSAAGLEASFGANWPVSLITGFGAVPDDTLDDAPALNAALAAASGEPRILYFPAGTYRFHSSISLPDSVIIRGDGADSTRFEFRFQGGSGNSFNIRSNQNQSFTALAGGFRRNSRKLFLPPGQAAFNVGDCIEIRQTNGAWDIAPASWASFSVGHLARIDSVSGDTIWLDEALRIDMDPLLQPEIRRITPRQAVGFECFSMTRTDAGSGGYGFYFSFARNCYIRGVESFKSVYAHVLLESTAHTQVSKSYFHEAFAYDGSGTRGYGVLLIAHAASNRVENCIFRKLRHAMIVKQGANGNVFGYNYSREPLRSEPIPDYAADICLHGHYAFANLFEGNIAQNLQIDIVWGPSGPYNTFFRNKIELYGLMMSSGSVQSDGQNFVGNDITGALGFYNLQGSGHFQYGNNVKGTITPAGTGSLNDVSYYLPAIPPDYWNILRPLPSVGIPNTFEQDINPALYRYRTGSGSFSRCGPEQAEQDTSGGTSGVAEETLPGFRVSSCSLQSGTLAFMLHSPEATDLSATLYNAAGQQIAVTRLYASAGVQMQHWSTGSLPAGMYLLRLRSGNRMAMHKWIHSGY
ncbi:MAG: glycosyl hydrolase family 28-related protein [Flavobacteriales bacterium]